jgi:hypothetical protein
MIEVRVRQDDGVERGRTDGQWLPVAGAQLFEPLKQATVDEDAVAVGFEQMFGAGHRARGSETGERHRLIQSLIAVK